MRIIKAGTKEAQRWIISARFHQGKTLYDVYDKPSKAKKEAYDSCWASFVEEAGVDFHMISHNTYGFTVAWNTNAGLRIETPQHSYLVEGGIL